MTLCWETAYKWASLSKRIASRCLNRNSTVAGVIITVTFCIISVCAPWIWGRMMATLMNQWANEAAIVLVYWNTLREIEYFCGISVLNVLLSYRWIASLVRRKGRKDANIVEKHSDWQLTLSKCMRGASAGEKEKEQEGSRGHGVVTCCSSTAHTSQSYGPKSPVWTEDGSGVTLADRVILQRQHAELLIIPALASFLFIKKC